MYPLEYMSAGSLYFTKNGRFLKSFVIQYEYFKIAWFPCVGIDSFSPVEINFGAKPFMYRDSEMIPTASDTRDYYLGSECKVMNKYYETPYPALLNPNESESSFFSPKVVFFFENYIILLSTISSIYLIHLSHQ